MANKYRIGDTLVVVVSAGKENVGKVGVVTEITDGDYYTLDTLPNYAFKENCLSRARGVDLIRRERQRQVEEEGYDARHDFRHTLKEFINAAIAYAIYEDDAYVSGDDGETCCEKLWPWDKEFWKPKDRKRNLVRAGALIAAAIDKIQMEEQLERYEQEKKED